MVKTNINLRLKCQFRSERYKRNGVHICETKIGHIHSHLKLKTKGGMGCIEKRIINGRSSTTLLSYHQQHILHTNVCLHSDIHQAMDLNALPVKMLIKLK